LQPVKVASCLAGFPTPQPTSRTVMEESMPIRWAR
jgi:hypothetical protein